MVSFDPNSRPARISTPRLYFAFAFIRSCPILAVAGHCIGVNAVPRKEQLKGADFILAGTTYLYNRAPITPAI